MRNRQEQYARRVKRLNEELVAADGPAGRLSAAVDFYRGAVARHRPGGDVVEEMVRALVSAGVEVYRKAGVKTA